MQCHKHLKSEGYNYKYNTSVRSPPRQTYPICTHFWLAAGEILTSVPAGEFCQLAGKPKSTSWLVKNQQIKNQQLAGMYVRLK